MSEPSKAEFGFENFKIIQFELNEEHSKAGISIDIIPKGTYYQSTGIFEETMTFTAFNEDKKNIFIKVTMVAMFKFTAPPKLESIPDYFYINSIAILFPYLRAFISNLTLQANLNVLVLPVLNLTGMDKPLRENTTVVE